MEFSLWEFGKKGADFDIKPVRCAFIGGESRWWQAMATIKACLPLSAVKSCALRHGLTCLAHTLVFSYDLCLRCIWGESVFVCIRRTLFGCSVSVWITKPLLIGLLAKGVLFPLLISRSSILSKRGEPPQSHP